MRQSACALFPFKQDNANNCLGRAQTLEDTLLSCIRMFLVTRPGSRVGNMTGSFLTTLMFEILASNSLQQFSNDLQQELIQNFPGVEFLAVQLTKGLNDQKAVLNVSISFTTINQSDITDLLVEMPSVFDSNMFKQTNNLTTQVNTLQFTGDSDFSL